MAAGFFEGIQKLARIGAAHLQHVRAAREAANLPPDQRLVRLAAYLKTLNASQFNGFKISMAIEAQREKTKAKKDLLLWMASQADAALRPAEPEADSPAPSESAGEPPGFQDFLHMMDAWYRRATQNEAERVEQEMLEYLQGLTESGLETLLAHAEQARSNIRGNIEQTKERDRNGGGGFIEDRMSYLLARIQTGQRDPRVAEEIREYESQLQFVSALSQMVSQRLADLRAQGNTTENPLERLVAIIERGDPGALAGIVASFPPVSNQEQAERAVRSGDPLLYLTGLCSFAQVWANTGDARAALPVGMALQIVARRRFEKTGNRDFLTPAAWATRCSSKCLERLGEPQEQVRFLGKSIAWLDEQDCQEGVCDLRLDLAEALLALGQFEECNQELALAESADIPAEHFATRYRRQRLREKLDRLARESSLAVKSDRAPADATTSNESLRAQVDAVLSNMTMLPPEQARALQPILETLRQELKRGKAAQDPLGTDDGTMEQLADFMGASDEPDSPVGVQKRIRALGRVLNDPVRGRDLATLRQCVPQVQAVIRAAQRNGMADDEHTALWELQCCYRRLDLHQDAIETIRLLWKGLERMRESIRDPYERAGVLRQFPYLFPLMTESLFRVGDFRGMLEAMEGGKGRLLSDTLDRNRVGGKAEAAAGTSSALNELPALCVKQRFHYLTFLVDDEATYAALVTREGAFHGVHIPIGRRTLRDYGAIVNPAKWGSKTSGLFGPPHPADLPERLAPLVSWLEPLAEEGVIAAGDHLCYNPDEEIHLLPLQMLRFRGYPLIRHISMSRIHSGAVLASLFRGKNQRPPRFTGFQVPAREDPPEIADQFQSVCRWLSAHLAGAECTGQRAEPSALPTHSLAGQLVHFTTHGIFPTPQNPALDPNPFRSSGLLLTAKGELPSKLQASRGDGNAHLLSPEKFLKLDLRGSDVVMQACSSGLSHEGLGGDALGLETALLLAGARSVVMAHWDVSVTSSNEFCKSFYARWLVRGHSRAEAWRDGSLEVLRRADGRLASQYAFGAFSLTGDWR